MQSRLAAVLALAAGLAGAPALADCKLSDIKIKSWDWRVDEALLHVVGEVTNSCAAPIVAEFQAVTHDAAGKVVATDEFFSVGRSIPSGDSSAFEHLAPWNAKGKTVDLKVIDLHEP